MNQLEFMTQMIYWVIFYKSKSVITLYHYLFFGTAKVIFISFGSASKTKTSMSAWTELFLNCKKLCHKEFNHHSNCKLALRQQLGTTFLTIFPLSHLPRTGAIDILVPLSKCLMKISLGFGARASFVTLHHKLTCNWCIILWVGGICLEIMTSIEHILKRFDWSNLSVIKKNRLSIILSLDHQSQQKSVVLSSQQQLKVNVLIG